MICYVCRKEITDRHYVEVAMLDIQNLKPVIDGPPPDSSDVIPVRKERVHTGLCIDSFRRAYMTIERGYV